MAAVLVTTACSLIGGLPLPILEHDTPLDLRFIRARVDVCCVDALVTA